MSASTIAPSTNTAVQPSKTAVTSTSATRFKDFDEAFQAIGDLPEFLPSWLKGFRAKGSFRIRTKFGNITLVAKKTWTSVKSRRTFIRFSYHMGMDPKTQKPYAGTFMAMVSYSRSYATHKIKLVTDREDMSFNSEAVLKWLDTPPAGGYTSVYASAKRGSECTGQYEDNAAICVKNWVDTKILLCKAGV